MHVGKHQPRLQRRAFLVVQPLDGAGHCAFGIRLRRRRHAGKHAHAGALQHAFRIVVRQLAPHQVHIRRKTVGSDQARLDRHAQRRSQRALVFGVVDQIVFVQLAEHEIASVQRAFRVAPRVVVRRPLDQPDQQCDLLGGHRIEFATEPQFRARRHAVDRLPAALAQIDLVEIGLQDGALVVARLHDHRVQDLVELARERLFLADAEQAATGQLLGQGAGALADLAAGARHDPGRAHHAAQIDAVMAVEVAVFHRLQAGDQQLGHFFHAHQAAFFLLLPVQGGDARRVQACALERLAVAGVAQAGHAPTGQADFDTARRHASIHIDVAAAGDGEAAAVLLVGAGQLRLTVVAVRRRVQLGLQRGRIQCVARHEHQRPAVHAGGDLPTQFAKALGDLLVQIHRIGNQETERQRERGKSPDDESALPAGALRVGVVLEIVGSVVVVASGHRNARM